MNPDLKAARLMASGMEFAVTVVAGVISGYYIDRWVGTPPLFTLLFTLAGMGGALYRLLWNLRQSRSVSDEEPHNDEAESTTEKDGGHRS